MTPVAKEAKRSDLQTRLSGMSKKKQDYNAAFESEKGKQIKPIQDKLLATIKAVAKEKGYGYVIDNSSNLLLVMPPGDDLLPLVKTKLGIKDPAPATKPVGN